MENPFLLKTGKGGKSGQERPCGGRGGDGSFTGNYRLVCVGGGNFLILAKRKRGGGGQPPQVDPEKGKFAFPPMPPQRGGFLIVLVLSEMKRERCRLLDLGERPSFRSKRFIPDRNLSTIVLEEVFSKGPGGEGGDKSLWKTVILSGVLPFPRREGRLHCN